MADGRRKVDLSTLPGWAKTVLALAVAALVGGLALLVAAPGRQLTVPVSAIAAAVLAFAFVAWRAQRRP